MVWIERWMAVLHLRRFRKYFRVTTAHFFVLRVFFLLWSYLCCRTDVGFMTFYFHYFLFIIVQCSHDLSDKIWFFNWVWSRQPNAFRFSTGILYNAFRFNILRQIMTIECMTTILIYKELDDKSYEYGNPKAWIKHEWISTSNTSPFTCIEILKLINYKQFNNTVNYLLIFSILVLFSFSIFASIISNTTTMKC